jgi:hypothetical protein
MLYCFARQAETLFGVRAAQVPCMVTNCVDVWFTQPCSVHTSTLNLA